MKYCWLFIAIGSLMGLWCLADCALEHKDYEYTRDTVESFGNGRFQLLKIIHQLVLYDRKTQGGLLEDVKHWQQRRDYVYAVNSSGLYCVLNYRTGEWINYERIGSAPKEHQVYLKRLGKIEWRPW